MKQFGFILFNLLFSITTFAKISTAENFNEIQHKFNYSKNISLENVHEILGVYLGQCETRAFFKNTEFFMQDSTILAFAYFKLLNIKEPQLFPVNWTATVVTNEVFLKKYFPSMIQTLTQSLKTGVNNSVNINYSGFSVIPDDQGSYSTIISKTYRKNYRFLKSPTNVTTNTDYKTSFRITDENVLISKIQYDRWNEEGNRIENRDEIYCSWYQQVKSCRQLPVSLRGGTQCSQKNGLN